MFIFAKHNFVEDFLHATGTGDSFLKQEMINDQIAKLIIEHKPKVIKALRDNGIEVKSKASNQKVTDLIIANVSYNKALVKELKNIIKKFNIPEKEFKFSADATINNQITDKDFHLNIDKAMESGISAVAKKKPLATKGISNADALKERIRLAEMNEGMLQKENKGLSVPVKIGIAFGIGVGATLLIMFGIGMYRKHKANKLAMGGGVGSPTPAVASASPAPAPVSATPAPMQI